MFVLYGTPWRTIIRFWKESLVSSQERRPPAAALAVIIPVAVALALTLFAWPATSLEPRDLPVGVVGAPAAVEQRLAQGGFDVQRYPDAAAARSAIRDRDIYGAIVSETAGTTVLTASAASATVAQLLPRTAAALGGSQRVEDVVPAPADDPRGAALTATVLPVVLAGMLTALLARALTPPGVRRIGALVAGAALAGLTAVLIVQAWLGVLEGGWLANAGVLALTVLAIAAPIVALAALLGPPGIGVGAALMLLIGNPWSGVSSAPELLPQAVGAIGQLLPPGAGGNLLRSSAFFDWNAAAGPLAVLLAWALLGLVALAVVARRQPASSPVR
jgi:hypothetical protein